MNVTKSTQTLIEAFNTLASEVQNLTDRKTILEHKLRFAHEQFQYLADKYAPAAPEISEAISKLQLPPTYLDHPSVKDVSVPLPRRNGTLNASHQIALLIRDGRRAASQLAVSSPIASVELPTATQDPARIYSHTDKHKPVQTSAVSASARAHTHSLSFSSSKGNTAHLQPTVTSMSTVLEQDFTVEGRKGQLECPFSAPPSMKQPPASNSLKSRPHGTEKGKGNVTEEKDKPHEDYDHQDPICASMVADENRSHDDRSIACPIRYLDKHSPEEIAQYVEKHKHQIPRSHEICVRRYQRNDEQVRKLDAKYGNLVSMIEGLSQLHKPMLASEEAALEEVRAQERKLQEEMDDDGGSGAEPAGADLNYKSQRVEQWARKVIRSASPNLASRSPDDESWGDSDDERGRASSHLDQVALKEVRVGESPSRPWGISVPVPDGGLAGLPPYKEEAGSTQSSAPVPVPVAARCPVSHDASKPPNTETHNHTKASGAGVPLKDAQAKKCPFDHTKLAAMGFARPAPATAVMAAEAEPQVASNISAPAPTSPTYSAPRRPDSQASNAGGKHRTGQHPGHAPTFVQFPENKRPSGPSNGAQVIPATPQMVFNGPVFIGYSVEDAMRLMQQFQMGSQSQ
ncbi:hypothetical protein BROUX41_005409 [Berkeleyomyces rouxiae]|uniref:uncharacterized protein n=1 Tax=Berkeleyomyces rouxiae TaxID=2035830 RepID=UPI003B7D10E9